MSRYKPFRDWWKASTSPFYKKNLQTIIPLTPDFKFGFWIKKNLNILPLSPVDRCRVFQSSPTAPLKTPKSPRPTHCVPHVVTPLNGLIGRRHSIYIFFLSSPSSSSSHSSFYLLKATQFFFFFPMKKKTRENVPFFCQFAYDGRDKSHGAYRAAGT